MRQKLALVFTLLLAIIVLSINQPVNAQEDEVPVSETEEEVSEVYWFYLTIKLTEISRKQNAYALVASEGSRVEKGTTPEFEKALWNNLLRKRITVGPFNETEAAENGRLFYSKVRISENDFKRERGYSSVEVAEVWDKDVFWFPISFENRERPKSYKLIQMPTIVSSGITTDFLDAMYENMNFGNLLIGPYWTTEQAETAIKLYKLNE